MSNYMDEMLQREMYKALYPPKKVKDMRQKAIDFLKKNKILKDAQTIWEVELCEGHEARNITFDLVELFSNFARSVQKLPVDWIPYPAETPKNLEYCLVCVRYGENKKPVVSVAQYTNGYGLEVRDDCADFGVYHEDDYVYYCPEGFYEFQEQAENQYHIDGDSVVTHFIPTNFLSLPTYE